ncbi:MAG: phage tail tape measure protein [bacterium]
MAELTILMKLRDEATKGIQGTLSQLKKAGIDVRQIGLAMTAAGAMITGSAIKMATDYANLGEELERLRSKTGMSTEALSIYRYMAQQVGISTDAVATAFRGMAAFVTEAGTNSGEASKALRGLGLSMDDLAGKSPEEAFNVLSRAVAGIEDPLKRSAMAQRVFGRSGTEILPILDLGADGMAKMQAEAERLGLVMDEKAMKSAIQMDYSIDQLKGSLLGLTTALARLVIPYLTPFADAMAKVIGKIIKWTEDNPELANTLAGIAIPLGVIMSIVGPMLVALPTLAKGWSLVSTAVGWVAAALGVTSLAAAGLIAMLVIGILMMVIPAIMYWDSITKDLANTWNYLWALFEAGKTIVAAYAVFAGAWLKWLFTEAIPYYVQLAWDTVWAWGEGAFEAGLNFILNLWEGIKSAAGWLWGVLKALGSYLWQALTSGFTGASLEMPKLPEWGNIPRSPVITPPVAPPPAPPPPVIIITNNIQGSVVSERDLTNVVRQNLLADMRRNVNTGIA